MRLIELGVQFGQGYAIGSRGRWKDIAAGSAARERESSGELSAGLGS
jgi:hypothetical protein